MNQWFRNKISSTLKQAILPLFLVVTFGVQAQQVETSIDRDTIKIGEQITYTMAIQTNPTTRVVFPQGQSFMPLEVIDSTAIDTLRQDNSYKLIKTYGLTQFDAGAYTIPKQTIIVNGEGVYTDTLQVQVNPVVVDTTKQKLYPIKPALTIDTPFSVANWIWWILGGLILLGLIVWGALKWRKKIIEKKRELPPYEKAIQTLKSLDSEEEFESVKMKDYYSSLSDAIKRYVDEKIDGRALESTTDEFIELLKTYKKDKQIYLKPQVIDSIEAVLKRADLAKFAGINTDKLTAREDRQTLEEDINAFDQAIPEPTEEEKLKDEAYRREVERKQQRRQLIKRISIGFGVLVVILIVLISINGFQKTKALLYSTPTETLLKGDWVKSEYGMLGMTVTTPQVLYRQLDSTKLLFPQKTQLEEHFSQGDINGNLLVNLLNVHFKKEAKLDTLNVGELLDKTLAPYHVANITFKHNDFKTYDNDIGQRVFGTFKLTDSTSGEEQSKQYTFLVFNERGGLQELLLVYNDNDAAAQKIVERISNSIEFKKPKQ